MLAERRVIKSNPLLTAVDLFSGCGGLSLGLAQAGFIVAAAVEIDRKAQETYKLNHPNVRLYNQDIRTIEPDQLMKEAGMKAGDLDLLAGCPPCQGFSRLRTKNKETAVADPRNSLVTEFARFVKVLLPKTIMMENVPALANDIGFSRVRKQLQDLGYEVVVQVLDAADYMVPQRRKRLIMLASRVHKPQLAVKANHRMTVREAFACVDAPSTTKDKLHAMRENRSLAVRNLIARIPKNGGSRSDLGWDKQLACHQRTNGFRDVYGRMAWNEVSPTITSGCHNPSKGRFLHPSYNRTITLREAALLQGFPKNYAFDLSHGKESIALMIGNALPPPFIRAHASTLYAALLETQAVNVDRNRP